MRRGYNGAGECLRSRIVDAPLEAADKMSASAEGVDMEDRTLHEAGTTQRWMMRMASKFLKEEDTIHDVVVRGDADESRCCSSMPPAAAAAAATVTLL